MLLTKPANDVFSPYDAGGDVRSVVNQEAQVWGTEVERLILAFQAGGGIIFPDKATMDASIAYAANQQAWVLGDATVANNGIYRKIGASGTGSWTRLGDLPYSFIIATDVGAGTPNAIQATTSIPVSASALVWFSVFEANTESPVTVSFNDGSSLTIKANSGNDIAVGGLTAGMIVMGIVSGSTFRLVSDQAGAAILAACEAALAAAEAAKDDAETAASAALAAANNQMTFNTVADLTTATIPLSVTAVRTSGYATAGDGGGWPLAVEVVNTGPLKPWQKQSNGGTRRWELRATTVYPEMFAQIIDGVGDHTAAIQAAIDCLPARGGEVRLQAKWYQITAGLNIGDGDGGTNFSTRNGVKFKGAGGGFGVSGAQVPTLIRYNGPAITTPVIDIKGRISDASVEDVFLELNGNAGGIRAKAFSNTTIRGVKIVGNSSNSVALEILGGGSPTGNYNVFNRIDQISIALTQPNSTGLLLDGVFAVQNDTWLSMFGVGRVEVVPGATNAICGHFKFVDSIDLSRWHFDSKPEATAKSVVLDALSNDQFPVGMLFQSCSIPSIEVREDGTHKIRANSFYSHGTEDLEVIPSHAKLKIITDNGVMYNFASATPFAFASGVGVGGVVTQLVSKSKPVTLNKACGVITMHNESIPAGSYKNFVFNNSLITSNDVVIPYIISAAAYGSYTVSIADVNNGNCVVVLRNVSGGALAEAVQISFVLVKVAVS
ncbi:UNVERIFIED_ORG: hypothetical protein LHK14_13255 [Roseateles sp. XES5]|nr:hypothetical protein [Roseateles sp. XES5]